MDREPILNSEGWTAIRHLRQSQKLITVNGRSYVFVVKASAISLAFVQPEDVEAILNFKYSCNCGGGSSAVGFVLASEADVRRWTNNGGF